jgi:hypothetical protein
MREIRLRIPELGLIGATRGLFGVGVGLLLASKIGKHRRKVAGLLLLAIGGLSSIPLGIGILLRQRSMNGRSKNGVTESAFAT